MKRKAVFHSKGLYQSPPRRSGVIREIPSLVRAYAEVDIVAEPAPELGLLLQVVSRLHLAFPPFHDVCIHGPKADSMTWNMRSPLLSDFRAHIGQPQGHIPGKVLQGFQVDLLIEVLRPRPATVDRRVRYTVGDDDDVDRRENEVAFLRDASHFVKERVEIG